MRICRLMMPLLAVLGAMAVAAPAQAITLKERLVLGAFNMCWQAEDGANLNQLLAQNGFARAPEARRPIYFRMVGGTTVMFTAYFTRDTAGEKENACRITALKPQLESPWTPRHAIFDEYQGLLDQLIGGAQKMGSGYRLLARRAPVPGRPGHLRTLLRLDEGSRARIIQVEEGPTFYEFIYFHAARGLADDPANLARIGDPRTRAQLQWMVDDSWKSRSAISTRTIAAHPNSAASRPKPKPARGRPGNRFRFPSPASGGSDRATTAHPNSAATTRPGGKTIIAAAAGNAERGDEAAQLLVASTGSSIFNRTIVLQHPECRDAKRGNCKSGCCIFKKHGVMLAGNEGCDLQGDSIGVKTGEPHRPELVCRDDQKDPQKPERQIDREGDQGQTAFTLYIPGKHGSDRAGQKQENEYSLGHPSDNDEHRHGGQQEGPKSQCCDHVLVLPSNRFGVSCPPKRFLRSGRRNP